MSAALTHLFMLAVGCVIGLAVFGHNGPTYTEVRDGQAPVVRYHVPELGECQAVLVRGRRFAEKCEASP